MSRTSIQFETSELLVVRVGENVRLRCPIDLTDLGYHEPLTGFLERHDGIDGTTLYLRNRLRYDVRRSMGLVTSPASIP